MKPAIVDVGELGWSLYLSAHARWLKANRVPIGLALVLPDRKCLYEGLVSSVRDVPAEFHNAFGNGKESCSGMEGVSASTIRQYFSRILAPSYYPYEMISFRCSPNWSKAYMNRMIFKPYPYKIKLLGKPEILVLPRYRSFKDRNIPKEFYITLIDSLCKSFSDCLIRTIGIANGAYNIDEIRHDNYINWVRKDSNLQDLIDKCQLAIGAVGSQSSPPKISLLQGVPTFMIGNEKERHLSIENWMGTKAGFYEIRKDSFSKFDFLDCIDRIVSFFKEVD